MSNPVGILKGRIATPPELRFDKDGKPVVNITIVTDHRRKTDAGEWESVRVSWWRCSAFGQLAENIAEYMEKGMAVIADGTLFQDDWVDKEGKTRTNLCAYLDSCGEDLRWRKRSDTTRPAVSKPATSFDEPPPF